MEHYNLVLILLMIFFGILGGIVNYFYDDTHSKKKVFKVIDYKLLKSIFTGIVSSLLVPLFLNMISSDIIQESKTDDTKLLVFCGFCLIASISSKAFIQTLSSKVLERINEVQNNVKDVKTEVSPIIHKHTEPNEGVSDQPQDLNGASNNCSSNQSVSSHFNETDTDNIKILKSLAYSQYTYRSKNGLCKDTGLDLEEVTKITKELITKGFVAQKSTQSGNKFYITEKGREHIQ